MDVEQTVQQARANLNTLTGNLAFDTLVSGIITFLVCCIAIRIIKAVMARALGRAAKLDAPVKNLITKLVTTFLWALTIIIVAGAFGINATSLVAVLSVAGLALSLSVQNLLTNFFSGIMLLINKPFKKGVLLSSATRSVRSKTSAFSTPSSTRRTTFPSPSPTAI